MNPVHLRLSGKEAPLGTKSSGPSPGTTLVETLVVVLLMSTVLAIVGFTFRDFAGVLTKVERTETGIENVWRGLERAGYEVRGGTEIYLPAPGSTDLSNELEFKRPDPDDPLDSSKSVVVRYYIGANQTLYREVRRARTDPAPIGKIDVAHNLRGFALKNLGSDALEFHASYSEGTLVFRQSLVVHRRNRL
jgi:hypothetical protein